MKKKYAFLMIFVFALTVFLLTGCGVQKPLTVDSIAIREGNEFSTSIGKFDCSDYTLVLNKDGAESYAPLTLDMISAADVMNFYKPGRYTITVNAYGQSCEFVLDVAENEFSGYSFENISTVYTGETVFAEVKGDLPQGTVVLYPDGNSFSEVGRYNVSAILTCNNYKTEVLNATVEITAARYETDGIRFDDAIFVYDGTPKSISVTGDIPEGVTVAYRIGSQYTNSRTNANEAGYEVTASFISANVNYEPIPDKTAHLIIKKADYDLSGIGIDGQSYRYSGEYRNVGFTAEDKLPKGVMFRDISATYVDGEGVTHTVPSENVLIGNTVKKIVPLKDAHDYTISYALSVADENNYNVPESLESRFEISKIAYELKDVFFLDDSFRYDGTPKSLSILGDVGEDLTVEYTGNGKTEVGSYEVTADFIVADPVNYIAPPSMKATLHILEGRYSLTVGDFLYDPDIPYTGEAIFPEISVELPEGLVFEKTVYKTAERGSIGAKGEMVDSAIELGSYLLQLHVGGEKIGNYYEIGDVYLPFNIVKRTFDTSDLQFTTTFDFDGKPHTPLAVNLPEGLTVSYDGFALDVADGRVAVKATFQPANEDYYGKYYIIPAPISTSVEILPIEYTKPYDFVMPDGNTYVYNGLEHGIEGQMLGDYQPGVPLKDMITVSYTLTRNGVPGVFEGNVASQVGEYVVTATVKLTGNENYYFPTFSAGMTITRGTVKASDIEKAIRVITTGNGKAVVFDKDLLDENYFVYDDFRGYYEKNADGTDGNLFEDPIELTFCDHDVYLKFNPTSLYSVVDGEGEVIDGYSPFVTVEMDDVFHFASEYEVTPEKSGMTIIEARGGAYRFATLRELKPEGERLTRIESIKLVHLGGDPVEYELSPVTEDGTTVFLMPEVELLGEYELKVTVGFLNSKFTGTVGIDYGAPLIVTVTKAGSGEIADLLWNTLRGQEIFMGNDGTLSTSYCWGQPNLDLILKNGSFTLSIDESKLGGMNAPYGNDVTDGVWFGVGELVYQYRFSTNEAWSTYRHVGNNLVLSDEGYYAVYFLPTIYDNLSGSDDIYSYSADSDFTPFPVIEFMLRALTHHVSSEELNGYTLFKEGGNWQGPTKFGELEDEGFYEYTNYESGYSPASLVTVKMLDLSGLPFYASVSVSDAIIDKYDKTHSYVRFTLTIYIDGEHADSKTLNAVLLRGE